MFDRGEVFFAFLYATIYGATGVAPNCKIAIGGVITDLFTSSVSTPSGGRGFVFKTVGWFAMLQA